MKAIILLLSLTFSVIYCDEECFVEDSLEKLILKTVDQAISYDFPKSNIEYFEGLEEDKIYDYGTFDFIIVGSGSSGSVLVNRLSEVKSWKVLLLEAGGEYDSFLDIPSMYTYAQNSKHNWGYNTTSQKFGCKGMIQNQCSYPRGKILGGSSSINCLIYTRGNSKDYDSWEKKGISGWKYKDVEPFFKKMENAQFKNKNLGNSGPLYLNYSSPYVPLQKIFSEALAKKGFPITEYNSENQLGSSRIQSNIKKGKRVCGANAYISPSSPRNNLNVTTEALVTKVLINDQRKAFGVRFVKEGKMFEALVRNEIILSAGAINTPQILMLSGIGPEYLLKEHNISIVKNLPVGETLIDQIAYNLHFSSNVSQESISLKQQISEFLKGTGLLTSPFNGKSLSFVGKENDERKTVEYVLIPPTGRSEYVNRPQSSPYIQSITDHFIKKIDPSSFFSVTIILLHPKSTGKVTIQSSDPKDFPLIDSKIFSEEEDIESLYNAIKFLIDLTKSEPFIAINASVFAPMPPCYQHEMYSKDYWYCAIKYMALPNYHSMGTTAMGVNESTSVVNQELKVHGMKNLRVADCGVIPSSITGHTSGPGFMIGEKLSSMLKNEYAVNDDETW